MAMSDFLKKWRAEILRGSVIFVVVVGLGLTIVSFAHKMESRVASGARGLIPQLAQTFNASLGGNFDDPGRTHGDSWSWHQKLNPGQTLAIRNLNGPVQVTAAPGSETVVTTEKSWRSSDPNSVTLQAVPTSAGAMICAVWPGSSGGECSAGHNMNVRMNGREHSDVAVKFVVQLAAGVKIDVGSVSGDVDIRGAAAPVSVNTVSGDLTVETASWPVNLSTVSGDITAATGTPGTGSSEIKTVSGDVTLGLPDHPNVTVSAHTVTGDISDDFAIPVNSEKYGPSHSMSGTIGSGGGVLNLNTVSGDIALNKATAAKLVNVGAAKKRGATAVTVTPPPAPPTPPKP